MVKSGLDQILYSIIYHQQRLALGIGAAACIALTIHHHHHPNQLSL